MPKTSHYSKLFVTPERFDETKMRALAGPNGWLLFVACNSGIKLAKAVKREYEELLEANSSDLEEIPLIGTDEKPITTVFEDTESCARLTQNVAGSSAVVFQCIHESETGNSVHENIQQLLQTIRTLRAHRAKTITVLTPYIPYARQDKPSFMQREATLAGLFADQLKIAGADICLTYHPHTYSIFGLYEPDITLVALSGLDLLIKMFEEKRGAKDVVAVSTDAGGARFTMHYANEMDIPYAIANKYRRAKDESNLIGIIGDLEEKKAAIIADDETVTGNSIIHTVESLYQTYGIKEIYAAVSHFKVKKKYLRNFVNANKKFGLKELHVTDSVPQIPEIAKIPFIKTHTLAGRFAATINRLHYNQSVRELTYKPKKKKK